MWSDERPLLAGLGCTKVILWSVNVLGDRILIIIDHTIYRRRLRAIRLL